MNNDRSRDRILLHFTKWYHNEQRDIGINIDIQLPRRDIRQVKYPWQRVFHRVMLFIDIVDILCGVCVCYAIPLISKAKLHIPIRLSAAMKIAFDITVNAHMWDVIHIALQYRTWFYNAFYSIGFDDWPGSIGHTWYYDAGSVFGDRIQATWNQNVRVTVLHPPVESSIDRSFPPPPAQTEGR